MSTEPDPLADLAGLEGVPSAISATRDAVDAVLTDRGLRRVSAEQRAAALLASAQATARLESDHPQIDQPQIDQPQARTTDEPEVDFLEPALRLYAELGELAAGLRTHPPQVLARAHVLLARGLLPDDQLGRPRGGAAESRLRDVYGLLRSRSGSSAIVLAAVVHAEIADMAPFGFGDGILARAVEHMILIEAGVDPSGVIICEAGHARSPRDYRAGLRAYRSGGASGVRDWILHCTRALAHGAEVSPLHSS